MVQPWMIPVIVQGGKAVMKLRKGKPPKTDFSELEAFLAESKTTPLSGNPDLGTGAISIPLPDIPTPSSTNNPVPSDRSSACVPCSRSHLSTISGTLAEALRFAREGGIAHPEAQRRLMTAEEEINVMERFDLSPSKVQASPEADKAIITTYLPQIRKLRQDIGAITSVDELEKVAAEAQTLGQQFRLAALQAKGITVDTVINLAKKVKAGEITLSQAKEKLANPKAPVTPEAQIRELHRQADELEQTIGLRPSELKQRQIYQQVHELRQEANKIERVISGIEPPIMAKPEYATGDLSIKKLERSGGARWQIVNKEGSILAGFGSEQEARDYLNKLAEKQEGKGTIIVSARQNKQYGGNLEDIEIPILALENIKADEIGYTFVSKIPNLPKELRQKYNLIHLPDIETRNKLLSSQKQLEPEPRKAGQNYATGRSK